MREKVDELLHIFKLLRCYTDLDRLKKVIFEKEQLDLFNIPYYWEIGSAKAFTIDVNVFNSYRQFKADNSEKREKDDRKLCEMECEKIIQNAHNNKNIDLISKRILDVVNY